jgi:uncharacterized Zn-finger protein
VSRLFAGLLFGLSFGLCGMLPDALGTGIAEGSDLSPSRVNDLIGADKQVLRPEADGAGIGRLAGSKRNSAAGSEEGHKRARKHVCSHCGNTFTQVSHLKDHERLHTGSKPYVCDYENCGSAFAQNSNLISHKKNHSNSFFIDSNRQSALLENASEDIFDVEEDVDFGGSSLVGPKRRNLEETDDRVLKKKHICNHKGCGKEFLNPSSLKRHIRTHTGEKLFVCDYKDCGKKFDQSGNLKTHEKMHSDEKPFVCGCGYASAYKSALKKHQATMHPEFVDLI